MRPCLLDGRTGSAPWRINAKGQHQDEQNKRDRDISHPSIQIGRRQYSSLLVNAVCKLDEIMSAVDALISDQGVIAKPVDKDIRMKPLARGARAFNKPRCRSAREGSDGIEHGRGKWTFRGRQPS